MSFIKFMSISLTLANVFLRIFFPAMNCLLYKRLRSTLLNFPSRGITVSWQYTAMHPLDVSTETHILKIPTCILKIISDVPQYWRQYILLLWIYAYYWIWQLLLCRQKLFFSMIRFQERPCFLLAESTGKYFKMERERNLHRVCYLWSLNWSKTASFVVSNLLLVIFSTFLVSCFF